jgi:hypothetical protein
MTRFRMFGLIGIGLVLASSVAQGQTAAKYRDFQLGGDLSSVAGLTGVAASAAKTLHARPAILQELQWRRPYALSSETAVDPVQQIAFSFYNDQLFRLVVDYDRERTQGMTDGDMIDAISAMYGAPVKAGSSTAGSLSAIEEDSGTRVARWGNADYGATLYRSAYASGFRLIVTSVPLTALARQAEVQAQRLDEREAPQRERARAQKEAEDARAAGDKARDVNKPAFRP